MGKCSLPAEVDFLLAAGEIDYHETSKFTHARKASKVLTSLAKMNGSYRKLPREFRAFVRSEFEVRSDAEASKQLRKVAQKLLKVKKLSEKERRKMRSHCSSFSRNWPTDPRRLIVSV